MIGDILQPTHLLFVLVIALLVLGPKRLPEVGRSLGRGLRDFRGAISGEDETRPAAGRQLTAPAPAEPVTQPAAATQPMPPVPPARPGRARPRADPGRRPAPPTDQRGSVARRCRPPRKPLRSSRCCA